MQLSSQRAPITALDDGDNDALQHPHKNMDMTTSHAAQDAPQNGFFALPPEIRNRVYTLAFSCSIRAYSPVLHYRRLEPCRCFNQPLMRVSKQMRRESVSLHYSMHEFHFVLFPPNRAVLLSWLDDVAGESVAWIRRLQLKRYVEGREVFLGERIQTVSVDLRGEEVEVEIRVAGRRTEKWEAVVVELEEILLGLPVVDGRRELSREKLVEMFDAVGWH